MKVEFTIAGRCSSEMQRTTRSATTTCTGALGCGTPVCCRWQSSQLACSLPSTCEWATFTVLSADTANTSRIATAAVRRLANRRSISERYSRESFWSIAESPPILTSLPFRSTPLPTCCPQRCIQGCRSAYSRTGGRPAAPRPQGGPSSSLLYQICTYGQ